MKKDIDFQVFLNNNYGGKVRVRVVGVCKKNNNYLLINHLGLNKANTFWCGPGGGVKSRELLETALKREFLEEANIVVNVEKQVGLYEYIEQPLHAIEIFFDVSIISGQSKLGQDPETDVQILEKMKWFSIEEIKKLPKDQIHQHFLKISS